jgi:hypothetical protein
MYDGYVFLCNSDSMQQCLSQKRYSCIGKESKSLEEMKAGTIIFLYNPDNKSLLGPFTVLPEGDELDAGAWAMDINEQNEPYADVKVTWEDLHIIQNAPEKLPFLKTPSTCKLSTTQTQRVLDLLKEGALYLYVKNKNE